MTEIFIARHGQNEDNASGILNGHRDLPLTGLGRKQAKELGEGIKAAGLQFDAVYSSPLSRAHETAVVAARIASLPEPVKYDGIIERDFGVMTGQPASRVEELCTPDIIKTETITYFAAISTARFTASSAFGICSSTSRRVTMSKAFSGISSAFA